MAQLKTQLCVLDPFDFSTYFQTVFNQAEPETKYREVGTDTQCQVTLQKEIEDVLTAVTNGTDITAIHDQGRTNLCHSYATISTFREVLRQFLRELRTELQFVDKVEIINDIITAMDTDGKYSFKIMLSAFLGSVNPRSATASSSQAARTETVVRRLVHGTVFEIAGWKRLLPIRQIFNDLELDIDNYQSNMEIVNHPNSHTIRAVQDAMFQPVYRWFETTGKVFPKVRSCWVV